MAQSFVNSDGTLYVPQATVKITPVRAKTGTGTSGVIVLVGEADAGPDFSLENPLSNNSFGPDQFAAVQRKYLSGNLVDAFQAAVSPLNDDRVPGAPTAVILVKTNISTKASGALTHLDASGYGSLFDKNYGDLGNLISYKVTNSQAEVLPTTGSFTYIPPVGTLQVGARVNGGARVTTSTLASPTTPTAFVAAIAGLTGMAAAGGATKATIQSAVGNLTVANTGGNSASITYSGGTFTVTPAVGDTIVIGASSAIAGTGNANVGAYVVTAASATVLNVTKLSDVSKPAAVIGTITAPVAATAAVSATPANDLQAYGSVSISLAAGTAIDGTSKSLELCELTGGTDLLTRAAFQLGTTTGVTWISKTGTGNAQLLTGTDLVVDLNITRALDSVSEDWTAGGNVGLSVSYLGTTATITVGPSTITSAVTGGAGAALPPITLSKFATLSDLAGYINAQTGWSCSVGNTALGQRSPMALDEGTYSCATEFGAQTGRIKTDAFDFFASVSGSALVQLGNPAAASNRGLPVPVGPVYLAGGAKGGTTAAGVGNAITASQKVRANFVVPLFSQDASLDIAAGLTDSSSTYTIDAIHLAMRTSMLSMSKIKAARNRLGGLSYRGTFQAAKNKALGMASSRVWMTFQDVKLLNSQNVVTQYQPWMLSVLAAGAQAAGGYRAIVRKILNCAGVLQAAGDFAEIETTDQESALLAGLLPVTVDDDGSIFWTSDQTTYSRDNNFLYNSMQAMYVSDQVALDAKSSFEKNYVGQTLAEVSAGDALTFLESKMSEYMRRKFLSSSADAPAGYRNATIQIQGGAMLVSAEIKVAGAIYFIPISFLVSEIQQSATQG